jgi:hypothetical protein
MREAERLYKVHLLLKKEAVSNNRKLCELRRLRQYFATQVSELMLAIHDASICLWTIMNTKPHAVMRDLFSRKYTASPGPVDPRICEALAKLRSDPTDYLQRNCSDGGMLSLNSFVCVLSLFNFIWSREWSEQFAQLIIRSPANVVPKLCDCLLVHPLTQVFFRSALTGAFEVLRGKPSSEATKLILTSLVRSSPLLPPFIRRVLQRSGQHPPGALFHRCFLRKALEYFYIFGVAHPEMKLYIGPELDRLLVDLGDFFDSDEGSVFVTKELLGDSAMVCIEPSEAALGNISSDYGPTTCVDAGVLRDISGDVRLRDTEVLFVPVASAYTSRKEESPPVDNLTRIVSRFLVNAELVKLTTNYKTAVEYFEALAEMTAPFGDPKLRADLDKLHEILRSSPTTLGEILDVIERRLSDHASDWNEDPLAEIADYSPRAAYLAKLAKFVQEIQKNALEWIEFNSITESVDELQGKTVQTSAEFVSYFVQVHDHVSERLAYTLTFSTRRSLFSILMHKTGIFESIKMRMELMHSDDNVLRFLKDRKAELIDEEHQPFLEPYLQNPEKLGMFLTHYNMAFATDWPFARLEHLHTAYQILAWLLQLQGLAEIGSDQIVPFALMATVYAAPPQLPTTQAVFAELIEPLISIASPLDHAMEYSLTQFLSTCAYVIAKMRDLGEDP